MLTRITGAAGLATLAVTVLFLINPAAAAADPGEPGDPATIPEPINPPDPTSYEMSVLGGIQSDKVADVMLHLYQGRTATGDSLSSDDDGGWGGKNSLLTCTLTGGVDYTVEVTTYSAGAAGRYTLHINVPGAMKSEGVQTGDASVAPEGGGRVG